jgi:hypothetical protein
LALKGLTNVQVIYIITAKNSISVKSLFRIYDIPLGIMLIH